MLATTKLHNSSEKFHDNSVSMKSYSGKIAKICAMHGVATGNSANLAPFMRALHDDKGLAMNFWSLMAKMHDLEQGSNERLLEAVAEAVTGRSVVEVHAAGGEPRRLIKQMAALLAGEDIDIASVVQAPAPAAREIARMVETAPAPVLTASVASESAVSPESKWQAVLARQEDERSQPMLLPEIVADAPKDKVRAIRVPLEGYGQRSASGSAKIAFAVMMVIAAAGAAFVARGDGALQKRVGPSVRAGYDAAWRGVKGMGGWISAEVFGR